MRRWAGWIFLLVLIALAARPLWASPLFFPSHDALLHIWRVFALDRALGQGMPYPRWLPDLAFGYGYPVFNFYPPFTEYAAETLHLAGLGFADAVKVVFIASIAIAVCGAYVFGADLFGKQEPNIAVAAGVLTATAYVCFPYFLLDVYTRGALKEAFAAALLPWIFWSLGRVLARQTAGAVILLAGLLVVVLLAHSLTLLLVAPVLIAYTLFELFNLPPQRRLGGLVRAMGATLLAVGLSAFYWLPFVAELSTVKLGRGIPAIAEAFSGGLLTLPNLIQSTLLYEYGQPPFPLGPVPLGLGGIALVLALVAGKRSGARGAVIFFGAVGVLAAVALSEPARGIWQAIPGATMVQFPWRISLLAGLGLATAIGSLPSLLSAWVGADVRKRTVYWGALGLMALALVWTSIANLKPTLVDYGGDLTLGQLARFELDSGYVGTTTWDEYFPPALKMADLVEWTAPASATDAVVKLERYRATDQAYAVHAREPITLSLRTFYSTDWQATVDNVPVSTFASTPLGLESVSIPAGEHHLVVTMGDTLPRQMGTVLSATSLFGALTLMAVLTVRRRPQAVPALLVAGTAIAVMGIPNLVAWVSPQPELQTVEKSVSPELNLIGFSVERARPESQVWRISESQATLHLQAIWHVTKSTHETAVLWQVRDDAGKVWTGRAQLPRYGTGFASGWVANEIVRDEYDLPLSQRMPPGRYQVWVAYGTASDYTAVGTIDLGRGSRAGPELLDVEHPVNAQIGDHLHLIGFTAHKPPQPGEPYPVNLYWQADGMITEDYTEFLQLADGEGNVVAQLDSDSSPGGPLSYTSLWAPGKIVIDRQTLNLPRNLAPGVYKLLAGLYRFPDLVRLPVTVGRDTAPDDVAVLGEVKVPMNVGNVQPAYPLGLAVGPTIRLEGFDLTARDGRGSILTANANAQPLALAVTRDAMLTLRLYWNAQSRPGDDYKVFVHIADAGHNLLAQEDRWPGDNRYPTRIWDAGERVLDSYTFALANLPPGRYTISVGMYAPETGERLSLSRSGGQALADREVILASVEVTGP